jgi:hypothetical protein
MLSFTSSDARTTPRAQAPDRGEPLPERLHNADVVLRAPPRRRQHAIAVDRSTFDATPPSARSRRLLITAHALRHVICHHVADVAMPATMFTQVERKAKQHVYSPPPPLRVDGARRLRPRRTRHAMRLSQPFAEMMSRDEMLTVSHENDLIDSTIENEDTPKLKK